jgi:type IV pilus assembly protein PilW
MSIAEGIEDLQLAYACDGCNAAVNSGVADRIIDDQGTLNNIYDIGDFVSDNTWTLAPMTPDTIRLVLVNIVARETRNEQGFGEGNITMVNTPAPIVVQDHNPSADAGYALATYQQFRRRLVTRTIEVRNIGL